MTNPTTKSGGLHTIHEVAERARLGASTISKLIREGRLPARKIGRKWLVAEQDVERLLTGGQP